MMDDPKNEFDDFEDEFFDDGLDDLDGGFGDVNADSANPDSFGDDWDFDENQADKAKKASKKGGKKNSNTLIIVAAVVIGFGVLVYQVMGDKILGGNKFDSSISEEQVADSETTDIQPVDLDALYEADSLGVEEYVERQAEIAAQQPPMPAPVTIEDEPLEETSSFMDDLEFSDYSNSGNQGQSMTLLQTPITADPEDTAEQQMRVGELNAKNASDQDPLAEEGVGGLPMPTANISDESQSLLDPITASQPLSNDPTMDNDGLTPLSAMSASEPVIEDPVAAPELTATKEIGLSDVNANDITSKLETIIQRLDKVEGVVSDIDLSPAQEILALKQTIASLEKDIAQLKKAPQAKVSATRSSTPAKKIAKVTPPKWELRAAQPGKAWVAKKGQKDIKSVSVGEKLNGLGTIHSIELVEGRWIVKGSSGTIRQ